MVRGTIYCTCFNEDCLLSRRLKGGEGESAPGAFKWSNLFRHILSHVCVHFACMVCSISFYFAILWSRELFYRSAKFCGGGVLIWEGYMWISFIGKQANKSISSVYGVRGPCFDAWGRGLGEGWAVFRLPKEYRGMRVDTGHQRAQCAILFSVVFTPPPLATTAVFGSYLTSLHSS